jgi:hypothetical protein
VKGVEELIGTPVVAGCVVNPPGSAGSIGRGAAARSLGAGATVGVHADGDVAAKSANALPQPTGSWEAAYLALTATDLVLVWVKQGLIRPKPGGELARIPRSAVVSYSLAEGGLQSPFALTLTDGAQWSFGLPKLYVKAAKGLIAELGVPQVS